MTTPFDVAVPKKESATDLVVNAIRDAIISGRIAPGERLRQDELRQAFDVSPAPVREALRRLESEGLVEHVANRGVSVISVGDDELREVILPVRLALERAALREAVGDPSESYLEQLAHRLDEIRAAVANDDLAAANEADIRFHQLAIDRSSSVHLKQLWGSVTPRLRAQFARLGRRHDDLHDIVAEHELLYEVVLAGDLERLDTALYDHVIESAVRLLGRRAGEVDQ